MKCSWIQKNVMTNALTYKNAKTGQDITALWWGWMKGLIRKFWVELLKIESYSFVFHSKFLMQWIICCTVTKLLILPTTLRGDKIENKQTSVKGRYFLQMEPTKHGAARSLAKWHSNANCQNSNLKLPKKTVDKDVSANNTIRQYRTKPGWTCYWTTVVAL